MRRRPPVAQKSNTPSNTPPGRVRIVAGKWRGRFLQVADLPELRPTSGRIRETLFNWLAPHIEGSRCLDLFAGTGVLGFEALSRGAADVHFVERAGPAVELLRLNIGKLGATAATLHACDAQTFLQAAARKPCKQKEWNIVFLDPPYADDSLEEMCTLLQVSNCLVPGASIYLEQDARQRQPVLPPGWTVRRENKAGNVRYCLVDAGRPTDIKHGH